MSNFVFDDLDSETISSADVSYILRAPKIKARITGFYSKIQNVTETSFFFAEGAFEDTDGDGGDAFVAELVTGMDKLQIGGEFGCMYWPFNIIPSGILIAVYLSTILNP